MEQSILTEVSLILKKVILVHCMSDVIVTDFHQIDSRLQITSSVRDVGHEDLSSTIDGH